jgi:hypothetical protein
MAVPVLNLPSTPRALLARLLTTITSFWESRGLDKVCHWAGNCEHFRHESDDLDEIDRVCKYPDQVQGYVLLTTSGMAGWK